MRSKGKLILEEPSVSSKALSRSETKNYDFDAIRKLHRSSQAILGMGLLSTGLYILFFCLLGFATKIPQNILLWALIVPTLLLVASVVLSIFNIVWANKNEYVTPYITKTKGIIFFAVFAGLVLAFATLFASLYFGVHVIFEDHFWLAIFILAILMASILALSVFAGIIGDGTMDILNRDKINRRLIFGTFYSKWSVLWTFISAGLTMAVLGGIYIGFQYMWGAINVIKNIWILLLIVLTLCIGPAVGIIIIYAKTAKSKDSMLILTIILAIIGTIGGAGSVNGFSYLLGALGSTKSDWNFDQSMYLVCIGPTILYLLSAISFFLSSINEHENITFRGKAQGCLGGSFGIALLLLIAGTYLFWGSDGKINATSLSCILGAVSTIVCYGLTASSLTLSSSTEYKGIYPVRDGISTTSLVFVCTSAIFAIIIVIIIVVIMIISALGIASFGALGNTGGGGVDSSGKSHYIGERVTINGKDITVTGYREGVDNYGNKYTIDWG